MSENNDFIANPLLDEAYVQVLIDGDSDDRQATNSEEARKATIDTLHQIEDLLMRAYCLSYLEASIHCDNYHEGKNAFNDIGCSYGYLHTYVSLNKGTIDARFKEKRPNEKGGFIRNNLPYGCSRGYTERQFEKYSAHEYEKALALLTEEQYTRIRSQGKTIKKMLSSLKKMNIYRKRS